MHPTDLLTPEEVAKVLALGDRLQPKEAVRHLRPTRPVILSVRTMWMLSPILYETQKTPMRQTSAGGRRRFRTSGDAPREEADRLALQEVAP